MLWILLLLPLASSSPVQTDYGPPLRPSEDDNAAWRLCIDHECPRGYACVIRKSDDFCGPTCVNAPPVDCNRTICIDMHTCIYEEVPCTQEPCFPVTRCVPDVDPNLPPPNPADCIGTPKCPKEEFWNACGGCDGTCESGPVFCPAICEPKKAACRCESGRLRDKNGNCVKEKDCKPPKYLPHKPDHPDPYGGSNPDSYPTPPPYKPKPDNNPAWRLCLGFVCNLGEVCVIQKGDDFCGPTCITSGPETCDTVRCLPGYICIHEEVVCVTEPCYAVPVCVKNRGEGLPPPNLDDCFASKPQIPKCPKGEIWNPCGGCDGTCETGPVACKMPCMPKEATCRCESGLLRGPNGNCIDPKDCKPPKYKPKPRKPDHGGHPDAYPTPYKPDKPKSRTGDPGWRLCVGFHCNPDEVCVILRGDDFCGPSCTKAGPVTCEFVDCPDNHSCIHEEVTCVTAPCYPEPVCVINPGGKFPIPDPDDCFATTPHGKKCPKGEIWNACGGCEGTCETGQIACRMPCMPEKATCRCIPPLLRGPKGNCIDEKDCKKSPHHPSKPGKPGHHGGNKPGYGTPPPNKPECGENEEFDTCGSHCEGKCSNKCQEYPCPPSCTRPACRCKHGFFRDDKTGKCVSKDGCKECRKHPYGTKPPKPDCPLPCSPPAYVCVVTDTGPQCVEVPPPICSFTHCDPPLVCQEPNGECVLPDDGYGGNKPGKSTPHPQKPPTYGPVGNPAWRLCLFQECDRRHVCIVRQEVDDFCGPFCLNIGPYSCNDAVCSKGNTCIHIEVECSDPPCYPVPKCVPDPGSNIPPPTSEECLATASSTPAKIPSCPKGEYWNPCGGCDGTCETEQVACRMPCMPEKATCRCNPPLLRGPNGKCIDEKDCKKPSPYHPSKPDKPDKHGGQKPDYGKPPPYKPEPKCGQNEVRNPCGNHCEGKCSKKCQPYPCLLICNPPACACKDDFFRDDKSGKCVRRDDCKECRYDSYGKPKKCGENEEFDTCGNHCEGKCSLKCEVYPCLPTCTRPACKCKVGFFRDDRTGKCVPRDGCKECRNTPYGTKPPHPDCPMPCSPPGYACVLTDTGPQCIEVPPPICSFTHCDPPLVCQEPNGECVLPKTKPKPPPYKDAPAVNPCSVIRCAAPTTCIVENGEGHCVTPMISENPYAN